MKKFCLNKYQNLDDLDSVKNREDRSTLIIHSLFPERFLSEEIAHPDEVKHLAIYLSFGDYEGSSCGCKRNRQGNNVCKDCFNWENKYNNTLCSGLTKFHNLETLYVVDLDLSCDLWIEFAKNCTCLKEIHFDSSMSDCYPDSFYWYNGKEAALDALFQIPTLEKVYVGYRIYMPYFPPGPSNIKYLYLHVQCDEEDKEISYETYAKNLHTHKNIKTLILNEDKKAYNILDLKLDQMQLEEFILESSNYDDIVILISLLPQTIKKIKFNVWLSDVSDVEKMLSTLRPLKFSNIEKIEVTITTRKGVVELYDYVNDLKQIKDRLQDEFKYVSTLKKFVFFNYHGCLVLDVLGS